MAKKKESESIRCKYAGDKSDEYCSKCDGLIVVATEGIPASECQGYEAEATVAQNPVEEPIETPEIETKITSTEKYTPKGVTTVIRAESGLSKEINGDWWKFTFTEERTLPPDCDVDAEILALWEHANSVVDNQMLEVTR